MAERNAGEVERATGRAVGIAVPLGTGVGALVTGLAFGPGPGVLVLGGGALLGSIIFFWSSLRSLTGDAEIDPAFDEAMLRAREQEVVERKKSVLRALKDLENERDVGKIDLEDYARLATHYRAEAKALLREIDDEIEPLREKAEQIAVAHMQKKGLLSAGYRDATPPTEDENDDLDRLSEHSGMRAREAMRAREEEERRKSGGHKNAPGSEADLPSQETFRVECDKCGVTNESDATFCKKCGAKMILANDEDG